MYSITDRKSFESIAYWIDQIQSHAVQDVSIVLIGSKVDIPDRQIEYAEGKHLADTHNVDFFETSAKDKINIMETFEALAGGIVKNLDSTKLDQSRRTHRLSSKRKVESKEHKKCCQSV